jgi:Tfp pilus assembly protein PilF
MTNEDVTSRLSQKYSIPSKRTKDDSEDILKKASLAHMEGRLREAEKGYLEVLRKKPDWGQVLNALGTVFLDQSQPDKAKKVFEKATDLRPPYLHACYNLARLKQRENDHKGAISIYRAILKRQPGYGQAWNNLGIAYRENRI